MIANALRTRRSGPLIALAAAVLMTSCSSGDGSPTTDDAADVPTSAWVIGPGHLGPIRIGLDGQDAERRGLALHERSPASCDIVWDTTPALTRAGVHLDFRDGSPDDLDQILLEGPSPGEKDTVASTMRTSEGAGIGTSIRKLHALYGDRLTRRIFQTEGAPTIAYTVSDKGGSIHFAAGNSLEGESDEVDAVFITADGPGTGLATGC